MAQKIDIPNGYISGLGREQPTPPIAHLYKVLTEEKGGYGPMCRYAWNRDNGFGFSIFRGNVGRKGICKTCMKRAQAGLNEVAPVERPTKWL